jgi:alkylation response protein AidB-like acyl-CoA dehydrogenase
VDHAIILEEELDSYGLTLPPYYDSGGRLGGATILVWGTEEQKRYFLPPIFKGLVRTWQLLSEPEAGSDLANVKTTALKNGDSYLVNGQKIFVGSHHGADWSWIIVNTDPGGKRHENLSWFIMPMDLPGISWAPMDLIFSGNESGALSGVKQTVYFENVQVPAYNLVGGENNGWKVASTHLELEHGLMQGSLGGDEFLGRIFRICKETYWGGFPLSKDPEVRAALVDMYIDAEVTRLFHLRNYWMRRTKRILSYEGPQAYLQMKRAALRTSKAVQRILGPYAITTDPQWGLEGGHVEVQQRGSIVAQHPGGTVEIQKVIMARRLGIGRAVREQAGVLH